MNVNPTVAWICATAIIVVVLAGVFTLVWHGSVSGGDALALVGGIVTLVGGIFGVHAGVNAGANAATKTSAPPS